MTRTAFSYYDPNGELDTEDIVDRWWGGKTYREKGRTLNVLASVLEDAGIKTRAEQMFRASVALTPHPVSVPFITNSEREDRGREERE